MSGWVKFHRSFFEWEWYDDLPTRVLFMTLIMKANHKDKNWKGIEVKRGQLITSLNSLVDLTGLTKQQIRTSLKRLNSTQEITQHATHSHTLITVMKYDFYQCRDDGLTQQTTQELTHSQHTANTKQELKNNKNNIYTEIQDSFNRHLGRLPEFKKLTDTRKRSINRIIKEYPKFKSIEAWNSLFNALNEFDVFNWMFTGQYDVNFDYITRTSKFTGIVEKIIHLNKES